MKNIFAEFAIDKMETDRYAPGVLVKLRKPEEWRETDLSEYELFSVILEKRVKEIDEKAIQDFRKRRLRKEKIKRMKKKFGKYVPFIF